LSGKKWGKMGKKEIRENNKIKRGKNEFLRSENM